jgi:anti-sigma factor RsiW
MTHVNEGDLQGYLDGALDPRGRAEVGRHLAACAECAAELEFLRGAVAEFALAVRVLDVPAAPVLEFRPRQQRSSAWSARFVSGAQGALLRAAVVVLLVSGVTWGALPGSPIRIWAAQVWQEGAALLARPDGAVEESGGAAQVEAALTGVSILPVGGEARVLLRELDPAIELRVRLGEEARLTVQWTGVGTDPHFRTAPGRVEVLGGGAGALLIEAPRATRTLIEVAGRVIAIAEGGRIQPLISARRAGDDVVFPTLSDG